MMESEEEALAHETYRTFDPSQLLQRIHKESTLKNICFLVVVIILICNYFQMRTLTDNYRQLQLLNQEMITTFKANRAEIQKEAHTRAEVNDQLRNEITKNIQNLKQSFEETETELRRETERLKEKVAKLQGIISKLRSEGRKQGNNINKESSTILATTNQENGSTNLVLSFLMSQVKEQFYESKAKWLKSLVGLPIFKEDKVKDSFLSALANINLPHYNALVDKNNKELANKIRARLQQTYNLDKQRKQLPFCIVVPTYNNAKDFRYQYNLQSIVNLNYTNFKVVIIDDGSTDGTVELISNLIDSLNSTIPITLLQNDLQMTAVPNINKAVRQHCEEEDIVVLVDGDDELLTRESLQVFNIVYQQQKADVVYSNHLKLYWHENQVYDGWSQAYSPEEKRANSYRDLPQKIAHLRSFKAKLFLQIREQDFKDDHGAWLRSAYDQVICLPLLELSCGRSVFIDQYFYLYNFGIGSNDLMVDSELQKKTADYVKYQKKKYECRDK